MQIQNTPASITEANLNQQDLAHWAGNWIWRAVQCLVESPDFNPSPKWSATRLNVSIEKIVEAFDGLERLNIIHRDQNTYKVNSNWFQLTPSETSRENLLTAHTRLAPQILSKLNPSDKFTVQFIRGDKQLIEKYAPKFIQLYKEMNNEAIANDMSDIIASEMSFVVLTGENKGGIQ